MKIVQVCSAQNATYGAVVSAMTLAEALRGRGHDVQWVTWRGREFGRTLEGLGFTVHPLRMRGKQDVFGAFRAAAVFRRLDADVVHGHLSTACVAAGVGGRIARVPSVASVHGLSNRWSYHFCDHLIAVSESVRQHLLAQRMRPDKVTTVRNGLPPVVALTRQGARDALGLPPDAWLVGVTARLTPLKGIDVFIASVAALMAEAPDVHGVVFGDGEARASLEGQAERTGFGERFHFMGYRKDVRTLLPALDAFLFPTRREALGLSAVEAMLAGVPVVASDVGGLPELLGRGAGRLVPVDSAELFTVALRGLHTDEAARLALAQRGKERAEAEFTSARMAAETEAVYDRLAAQRRR